MIDNRATGWKIPLLFCAAVVCFVVLVAGLRPAPEKVEVPPVPEALLARAKAIIIDLNASPEGALWKQRITAAGSGFISHDDKDARLERVIRDAVAQRRFDAACTASVLVYDIPKRDGLLEDIAQTAAADCPTLPWGVMAAHGMRDPVVQSRTHDMLTKRWTACEKEH